jgi:phosphohistidine phosphatase
LSARLDRWISEDSHRVGSTIHERVQSVILYRHDRASGNDNGIRCRRRRDILQEEGVRLLLIRHASAVPRGTPGIRDEDRPLTPRGEQRFTKAARGLAVLVSRPDALVSSPLPRARRTAEIAAAAWGGLPLRTSHALLEDSFDSLANELRAFPDGASVVLVGHEPDLSSLLAQILGECRSEAFGFKKGGAALVEIDVIAAGRGRLVWFLPPRVLRRLGDREA